MLYDIIHTCAVMQVSQLFTVESLWFIFFRSVHSKVSGQQRLTCSSAPDSSSLSRSCSHIGQSNRIWFCAGSCTPSCVVSDCVVCCAVKTDCCMNHSVCCSITHPGSSDGGEVLSFKATVRLFTSFTYSVSTFFKYKQSMN